MAAIVYQKDKRSGSTYAYSMESVRDPVTGKCKPKRTYIGRVDPITKTIIKKALAGSKNRSGVTQKQVDKIGDATKEKLEELNLQVKDLNNEIERLKKEKIASDKLLDHIVETIQKHYASSH